MITVPYDRDMEIDYLRPSASNRCLARAGAALAVAGLLGTLVGCGGDQSAGPSDTPPTSPAAAPDASNPCTLLSPEAVGRTFGVDGVTSTQKPPQTAVNGLRVVTCEYRSQAGSLGGLSVAVTNGSVTPAQVVAAVRQRVPGATPVAGVGDAAVYYVDPKNSGGALIQAAKPWRGQTIVLNYAGSARAPQEQLAGLLKQAIDVV
jgi:hypothetical protein